MRRNLSAAILCAVLLAAPVPARGDDPGGGHGNAHHPHHPHHESSSTSPSTGPMFRGLRFGVDIKEQIPECRPAIPKTCWREIYTGFGSLTVHFVDKIEVGDLQTFYAQQKPLAEPGPNRETQYQLVSLRVEIAVDDFADIDALLKQKYGRPHVSVDPWQSKGGVRTTATTHIWRQGGLFVSLESRTSDIDHGSLFVTTTSYLDREARKDAERRKKGVGDL